MRKLALTAMFLSAQLSGLATAAELPTCPVPKSAALQKEPVGKSNAKARPAAQRGLDFLTRETVHWQESTKCFGCHTQGVTLEALSVGVHNQYKIDKSGLRAIVDMMLNGSGGARRNKGFSHLEMHYFGTAKSFGGNAFARYDKWVGEDLRHDSIKVAGELIEYQKEDGSVDSDYPTMLPIAVGVVQRTYQAAQTWRQAHARSADDRWLLPIQKAERYLQATARTWMQTPPSNIQELNYGLLGLQAAGVSTSEPAVRALSKRVLSLQNHDGGWGYSGTGGDASNALATGETVYTLRMLGMTDRDQQVARGTDWLIAHQNQDGGWSNGGSAKGEAMWAVLGLVSVDVLTVSVEGLEDGQHVDGSLSIKSEARDNSDKGAGGVTSLEIAIDDLPVQRVCGSSLSYGWDTSKLEPGKHLVDLTATNAKGQVSSRRLEVYAGNVFLTQIGSRSGDTGTVVSLRNIAPKAGGTVELQILKPDGQGAPIATLSQDGQPGPMTFTWDGKTKGKAAAAGKYLARVVYRDADKKQVQREEQVVVLDTVANQERTYGQIQGHIALPKGANAPAAAAAPVASNAQVELVDDKGRVVQSVRSTGEGNYRFKNVDQGNYKVRFRKQGFAAPEQDVRAAQGKESAADALMR